LEVLVRNLLVILAFCVFSPIAFAQTASEWLAGLPQAKDYVQKRASSYDRSGGNADYRKIAPGETLVLMDERGPAEITHFWTTMWAQGPALKALVLRMYWDEEKTPSVESPLGDFFGLGLGDYVIYESAPLSVAPNRALNSFFPMPFQKRARLTLTNEGSKEVGAFYFNIDYRTYGRALPSDLLYFHAQYRQASPNHGWTNEWQSNGDRIVEDKKNLDGAGNYVWMEAQGRGHFAGVTMSVLQNQDGWWGEGDDMFFVDGESTPSINGTGSEDYFLGAFDFGERAFSFAQFGAPLKGEERAGSRSSVYRFHLDSPITFTKSLRATIEHGHANARSDDYFSVAYWYQTEPHAAFPILPALHDRLPQLHPVGGPGNENK
jgi:Protein of unknown function (DUF2961)